MQPRTPRSYALAVPVHPLLGERGQGKIFWTAGAPSAEAANTVHRKAHGLVARRRFRGGGRVVIRRRACREPDRPRRCRPPRRNGRCVAQPDAVRAPGTARRPDHEITRGGRRRARAHTREFKGRLPDLATAPGRHGVRIRSS